MKIAIDIGYGDVKVSAENGKTFKFTNAISYAGATSVDYGSNALEIFNFEGIEYLVGEQALLNDPFITREYANLFQYAPLLVYKALKMLGIKPGEEIQLATGLSLKDYDKAAEFGKNLTKIFVNEELYEIKPKNIKIKPQGRGIYVDFKNNLPKIELDFFAIVDIGYNTFDFLVYMNDKPVPNKNYANTLGVNIVVQQVQIVLNKQFKSNFSEQEVNQFLLTKQVRIGSTTHDISHTIRTEVSKYVMKLKNEINAKNSDIISKVFNVVISGGGAYLLEEHKIKMFDHEAYSKTPHEFANVRGYLAEI